MVWIACFLPLVFVWTGMAAEFVVLPCDRHMFDSNIGNCLSEFNSSMETGSHQDRCPWPTVKHIYNKLKLCVDTWANLSWCDRHLVDKVFLDVHQTYFSLCGQVRDPPVTTLIMLITPGIVVTLVFPFVCTYLITVR